MDTLTLGTTGRQTTRLGFGCSSIMGGLGYRDSLRMLESAWDAGVRHFDVAPSYGFGEAEACLGDFLRRHKGEVTVTTKFGIPSAPGSPFARLARSAARPVLKRLPALRRRMGGAASASATIPPVEEPAVPKPPNPIFRVEEARKSLARSLAALKTDYLDVLLLHEVTSEDLVNDDLLRFLEDSVQAGTLGTFGAGSGRNQIERLLRNHPGYCPVLQYEWSIFNPVPRTTQSFRLHHRSLTGNFHALHDALLSDRDRSRRWSEQTGADLADAGVLAKLMLKASLVLNPDSVILFSSKSASHIQANVALAGNDALTTPALALYRIVQAEFASGT